MASPPLLPGVDVLRAELERRDMPIAELERRLGLANGNISHWLAGRQRPGLHGALQLERMLKIDPALWETADECARRVPDANDAPEAPATRAA